MARLPLFFVPTSALAVRQQSGVVTDGLWRPQQQSHILYRQGYCGSQNSRLPRDQSATAPELRTDSLPHHSTIRCHCPRLRSSDACAFLDIWSLHCLRGCRSSSSEPTHGHHNFISPHGGLRWPAPPPRQASTLCSGSSSFP